MLNRENLKSLRETYKVPKGEEQDVHYAIERVTHDTATGRKISHYDIIKTNVIMFDSVKRNLELQGYTVFVIYHPQGKYNELPAATSVEDMLDEKDAEIARLKAELENATKKKVVKEENAPEKEEAKENLPNLAEEESEEKPRKKYNKSK